MLLALLLSVVVLTAVVLATDITDLFGDNRL